MITKKQIKEIREHLEKAQNPIFFFDNDQDGLCSFLLLRRMIGRGKGVPIKVSPKMTVDYFRKINELNPDYIFILDQPDVSKEFFEEVERINLPVVWIDHHKIELKSIPNFVNYYNPLYNKGKTNEPVTDLCFKIANKKEDLWIAVAGCIADSFFPDFYKEFEKKYSDLAINSKSAFEIFYDSGIGRISRIFGAGLKNKTLEVIKMLNYLVKIKSPYEFLDENSKNYFIYERFNEINKKYQKLVKKAKLSADDSKLLFFKYAGDTSMSADLANRLMYLFPKKFIVVCYIKNSKANVSTRGKNIKKFILKAIEDLDGATGGGHENAVGAQIRVKDLEKFKKNILELIK